MASREKIQAFLAQQAFGVAGASVDRSKYGNKILRCYQQHQKEAIPINPKETMVEGIPAVKSVMDLPDHVKSLSIITPPHITDQVVDAAIQKGITHIWMQPGAQSDTAIEKAEAANIEVIADGSCLLVILGFSDH